jgi:hypothetical protein
LSSVIPLNGIQPADRRPLRLDGQEFARMSPQGAVAMGIGHVVEGGRSLFLTGEASMVPRGVRTQEPVLVHIFVAEFAYWKSSMQRSRWACQANETITSWTDHAVQHAPERTFLSHVDAG